MTCFIETNRLILRSWTEEDLEPFVQMNACEKVCMFFPSVLTRSDSEALYAKIQRHFSQYGYGLYALEEKETQRFIGFTGLSHPDFEAPFMPAVEIGWRLNASDWGKGLATEAASAVLDYAFNVLALPEIVSFTAVENKASRRVMEKIGMVWHKQESFLHPKLPKEHTLAKHVLYRVHIKA